MKKGKSKGVIALVIIAIVVVVLLVTCPKKQAHLDAIDNVYTEAAANQENGNLISTIGNYLGGKIAGTAIKQMLVVDDYFVCSVGTINTKEGKKPLSIGVLGHVFILDKEKMVRLGAE